MKTYFAKTCALLILVLILSACGAATTTPTNPTPEGPEPSPEESVVASAQFEGANGYDVSGMATVGDLEGQLTLRFAEDFASSSGPDLHVWLVKNEADLGDVLELGELRTTKGKQSYALPEGTVLEDYSYIYIWCKSASALFGRAVLEDS